MVSIVVVVPADRAGLAMDDAWGNPLRYALRDRHWSVRSLGADGERGPSDDGPSVDFADDLVVRDGEPFAWPEKPCSEGPRRVKSANEPVDLRGRQRP